MASYLNSFLMMKGVYRSKRRYQVQCCIRRRQLNKYFSFSVHGEEGARQLAEEWRTKMEVEKLVNEIVDKIEFDELYPVGKQFTRAEVKWIRLEEFPNYCVSEDGDVAKLYPYFRPLKPSIGRSGYSYTTPKNESGFLTRSIHRLVAKCFVENEFPSRNNVVHHVDENKENNAASNLKWVTTQENVRASLKNRKRPREPEIYTGDFPEEKWRDLELCSSNEVNKFPYLVSSLGRIRNKRRKLIRRQPNGTVPLSINGNQKHFKLSRVILHGFGREKPSKMAEADHIDSNPSNDLLTNLRWVRDRVGNMKNEATRRKMSLANSRNIEVEEIDSSETWIHSGINSLASKLHMSARTIRTYCDTGRSYKNFIFRSVNK